MAQVRESARSRRHGRRAAGRARRAHAARGGAHAAHGRPRSRGASSASCAPCPRAWPPAATSPTWPCSATTRARSTPAARRSRRPASASSSARRRRLPLQPGHHRGRRAATTSPPATSPATVRRGSWAAQRTGRRGVQPRAAGRVPRRGSYRNLMVWRGGSDDARPPRRTTARLRRRGVPAADGAARPAARADGPRPRRVADRRGQPDQATDIWLWGQGRAPRLPLIPRAARPERRRRRRRRPGQGHRPLRRARGVDVPGATGNIDTDYAAKARAALAALTATTSSRARRGARRGRAHGQRRGEGQGHRGGRSRGRRAPRARRAVDACSSCPTTRRRCACARTS